MMIGTALRMNLILALLSVGKANSNLRGVPFLEHDFSYDRRLEQLYCNAIKAPPTCNRKKHVIPSCMPFRSPDYCLLDESFLTLVQKRTRSYRDRSLSSDYWFQHLEDKVASYIFVANSGFRAPQVYCCLTDVDDLSDCIDSLESSQRGFVIKATREHSSKGVYAMPKGFTGKSLELLSGISTSIEDIIVDLKRTNPTKIIVEEFVGDSLPTEYKFHMFNGQVGSIDVISGRATDCACYASLSPEWQRLDSYGCFLPGGSQQKNRDCDAIDFHVGAVNIGPIKGMPLCGEIPLPGETIASSKSQDPKLNCRLNEMIEIAKSLSKDIGVYIRIDMFVDNDGSIFIQEFSPNPMNGMRHCSARLDPKTGCIDSCFLGRMWKEGGEYGGPKTSTPAYFKDWTGLTSRQQCDRVLQTRVKKHATTGCRVEQQRALQEGNSTTEGGGGGGTMKAKDSKCEMERMIVNEQFDNAVTGWRNGFLNTTNNSLMTADSARPTSKIFMVPRYAQSIRIEYAQYGDQQISMNDEPIKMESSSGVTESGIKWSRDGSQVMLKVPRTYYNRNGRFQLRFTGTGSIDDLTFVALFDCERCKKEEIWYNENFESNKAPGWSLGRTASSKEEGTFLGPFNQGESTKKILLIPFLPESVKVQFDVLSSDLEKITASINDEIIKVKKSGKTRKGIVWVLESRKVNLNRIVATIPKQVFPDNRLELRFQFESEGSIDNIKLFNIFADCVGLTSATKLRHIKEHLKQPHKTEHGVKSHHRHHHKKCKLDRLIVDEDFEDNNVAGWKNGKTDRTYGLSTFLRKGSKDTMPSKAFMVPRYSDHITVKFDLYETGRINKQETASTFVVLVENGEVSLGKFQNDSPIGQRNGTSSTGIEWSIFPIKKRRWMTFSYRSYERKYKVALQVPRKIYQDHGRLDIKFKHDTEDTVSERSAGVDNVKLHSHFDCDRCKQEELFYHETFENKKFDGWKKGRVTTDLNLSSFLGLYSGGNKVWKIITIPFLPSYVKVQFDLYEIGISSNTDEIYAYLDGEKVDLGGFNGDIDEGSRKGRTINGITWNMESITPPSRNGKYIHQKHRVIATVPKQFLTDERLELKMQFGIKKTKQDILGGIDNVKLYNMFTDCKPIQSSKGVKTKSENTGMSTFQTKDKALDHAVPTKADQTSVAKTSECIENRLVVDETFESNSKAGWHGGRISRSEKLGAFLGPFKSHHEVSKSFSVPSYATKIDLSFDFIQLGNWESEVGPEGPDRLFVYVNHVKMDLGYFRSGDKNPEVRVGKTNGGIRWNVQPNGEASHLYGEQESKDQVYRVTINVPKRYFLEGKISLRFLPSMKGTQDEFAAFDNLKIHSTIPCSVCKPKVRISFEDFENSRPLSGWHGGKIESGGTFTTFLGRLFSGNVARKIYAIPASANSVTIDMNIYEIDGFDGFGIDEKGTNGPDKIAVYVDKSRIDLGVFSHTEDEGTRSGVVNGIQWNMTSLTKPANIAFKGYYKDQKHRVLLSIPRNLYQDGRLELKVHADMHGMNDEYVGVDNLKLVANYDCSAAASHITDAVII